MGFFGLIKRKTELRSQAVEQDAVAISNPNFFDLINLFNGSTSSTGVVVNTDAALGVPAIWAAVNFLSGTFASIPLHLYEKKDGVSSRVRGGLADVLNKAPNDEMSSFDWRKLIFDAVFTGGRGFTFIERNAAGTITDLWPLDPAKVTIKRAKGRKVYKYKDGRKTHTYKASEIIDIAFMLNVDGVSHRGPLNTLKNTIGLSIAATEFGSKFFKNGGVPAFAVTGQFQSGAAMERASEDFDLAVRTAAKSERQALVLPTGLEIKQLGVDAEKSQLVELKRFCIEEIARIYSLPPTFLQDLSKGTFSNTEQQDLHVTKHTLRRWVVQFEKEINLKLFGRENAKGFSVEFNLDGLLRGDFKTRMEGFATGIQSGVIKPNEARQKENLPTDEHGDQLMIQGATVPIANQAQPEGDSK